MKIKLLFIRPTGTTTAVCVGLASDNSSRDFYCTGTWEWWIAEIKIPEDSKLLQPQPEEGPCFDGEFIVGDFRNV